MIIHCIRIINTLIYTLGAIVFGMWGLLLLVYGVHFSPAIIVASSALQAKVDEGYVGFVIALGPLMYLVTIIVVPIITVWRLWAWWEIVTTKMNNKLEKVWTNKSPYAAN